MSGLFLSRISLRAEPSIATLAPILFDTTGRHRSEASRRLVWTLFADREDRARDFLWREDDARRFYVLSSRQPQDQHHLFTVETKAFEPALSSGDKLVFSVRANATISRAQARRQAGAGEKNATRDVVMAALTAIPKDVACRAAAGNLSSRKVSRGCGARGPRQVLTSTKVASRSMATSRWRSAASATTP